MKIKYAIFIFIICCCNILCKEENVKKLECQGVYIYTEKKKQKDFFFEKPHFAIYKEENNDIYNSNEHFNGLSIFIKQKVKNYEKDKKKVFYNFLCRIYYEYFSSSICEDILLSTNLKKENKKKENKKKKNFEYISHLSRNINGLYISNKYFEKLYKNCSFNINNYINKSCLSHNYILFNWRNERDITKLKEHKNKDEIENKDVWSFIYISKTDLIKAHFGFYMKKFFFQTLKKKNKGIYFLFDFFIRNNILKNISIINFIEKVYFDENKKENFQGDSLIYKYVFNISFSMYIKNYKNIDNISFFFSKFYCEDKKNKLFFMNSFFNNHIYIYSKDSGKSIKYENNIYSNGIEKKIFLLSYIYSNIVIKNKEENIKIYSFLNYDIKDFPFLFHDNFYDINDYIIYNEKLNEIISKKSILHVYVNKVIENEGMNKETKTIINIRNTKNNYKDFFFLKKCQIIVVDLYPNNIIIDKEKTDSHLKFSYVDIENYKNESSHIITKYENENLFKKINYTNIISNISNRLYLNLDNVITYKCNKISQKKCLGKLYFYKNNFSNNMKNDVFIKYGKRLIKNNGVLKKSYNNDEQKVLSKTKVHNCLNCNDNYFTFSYKTPLHSRYVAPCYKNLCTNYDIVIISNAKPFLMCKDKNNRQNNRLNKIYENDSYGINNNYSNITIFADSKYVYINKDENILSVYTKDFYIYLNEISFYSFFNQRKMEKTKDDKILPSEKEEKNDYINEIENFSEDNNFFNDFVYIRTKNNKKYKIFNFNKIHNDKKLPYNIIEANNVKKFDIPIYYNFYYSKKPYSDIVYLYSIPRGNENYLFVLYLSSFVSFFLIICTFYISYKFP
ncbi:conserved Plasmodium protein, unknown function [Plasmodium gallinaceum]|uniref:Uncharacterized protein n=1 Tax=Plasmodium gallinaceum TaxID=5849 RepID=A0A1J1GWF0_PLAGA|nr:conserved Plasmodium protein, unknown function [Plasmodium gallinaceum]CRG96883.1 conserved Plasmodium protein, unknown function [Plasmodium gallinaceum]